MHREVISETPAMMCTYLLDKGLGDNDAYEWETEWINYMLDDFIDDSPFSISIQGDRSMKDGLGINLSLFPSLRLSHAHI